MTDKPKTPSRPFWQTKTLHEMSREEWESLCDGCAKCCLVKLEDRESGDVVYTDVVCDLLECETGRCSDYANRSRRVPNCITLTPPAPGVCNNLGALDWMPPSCAYRLLRDGRELPSWHPLVSGTRDSVYQAGMSVRGRVVYEKNVLDEDLEDRVVVWPLASDPQEKND